MIARSVFRVMPDEPPMSLSRFLLAPVQSYIYACIYMYTYIGARCMHARLARCIRSLLVCLYREVSFLLCWGEREGACLSTKPLKSQVRFRPSLSSLASAFRRPVQIRRLLKILRSLHSSLHFGLLCSRRKSGARPTVITTDSGLCVYVGQVC